MVGTTESAHIDSVSAEPEILSEVWKVRYASCYRRRLDRPGFM